MAPTSTQPDSREKILVALSGGVDSSVAASLLLDAGHEVMGVFLCLGAAGDDAGERSCCSPQDAADARRVADKLGIELHVLNVQDRFAPIIDYFVSEYAAGRTPNPCIHCNTLLKFGRLIVLAESLGFDAVATGHYARIVSQQGHPAIARGRALAKDQSYALFGVSRDHLPKIRLPLGEFDDKARVREIARERGLITHDKPDSQDICFVTDSNYAPLLASRAPQALTPGRIVNRDGETLGEHQGIGRFTIGQRRGLGIAAAHPLYVIALDADTATVTVGPREETLSTTFTVNNVNWQTPPPPINIPFEADVQIRYNHRGAKAAVLRHENETLEVIFHEPEHAITPGQAAVLYQNNTLQAGGWTHDVEAAGNYEL